MMQTKHNWTKEEILAIYNKPMMELLFDAATVHRANHNPNQVQVSTLLSIKTGGCPEDCGSYPNLADPALTSAVHGCVFNKSIHA